MEEKIRKVGRRLGDLSDIPEELRKELQEQIAGDFELKVIKIIKDFDGIANVDEILVALYRQFQQIKTRQFVVNKLYKMAQNGLVKVVPKKRGIYELIEEQK